MKTADNIFMIVAMTEKTGAIGKNNGMLFHLPEDLKYFKATTLNNTMVCGYNTWLSFPKRPLPDRTNIVLSRHNRDVEGALLLHSVEDVLNYAEKNPDEKIFIAGGDEIYRQFINHASKLYVTMIEENETVDAEKFFPEIDESWELESEVIGKTEKPALRFQVYKKRDI